MEKRVNFRYQGDMEEKEKGIIIFGQFSFLFLDFVKTYTKISFVRFLNETYEMN